MTCIVGIADGERVLIGADSAAVEGGGFALSVRADRKVVRVGDFAFGFTTSFRMGQLLAHTFTPPARRHGQDLFGYMVADFVPACRQVFELGGWAEVRDGRHTGGDFLVGHAGRLFCVYSDFQVAEQAADFSSVGCGAELARGALWATQGQPMRSRAELALRAAAAMSAGVRGPFHFEELSRLEPFQ